MKIRIISATVAFILAGVILFLSDTLVLNVAIAVFTATMLYEVFTAIKCMQFKPTIIICFIFSLAMPFFILEILKPYRYLFLVTSIIFIFSTYLLQYKKLSFEKLCVMITSTILITLAMYSLLQIKESHPKHGLFLLILSLCGAWFSDIGAYFAGTFFGKHKLCPQISPKKTYEGLLGGIILTSGLFVAITYIYSAICSSNGETIQFNIFLIAFLGVVCAFLGLLGDLSASLLKRQCQIKDYGNIMPGHGGVLDRFDSILFIVPFMTVVSSYIDIIK